MQVSQDVPGNETAFVTVVGAALGEKAFGTTPDKAKVWATLRSETDDTMPRIVGYAEQLVRASASASDLEVDIEYEDVFKATINSQLAVELVRSAVGPNSLKVPDRPFR